LTLFGTSIIAYLGGSFWGTPLGDLAMHGGMISAVASFLLVLLAALKGEPKQRIRPNRTRRSSRPVLVDGSNVMHWVEGKPNLATVKLVVRDLQRQGYAPTVWFDANVGYLTRGRYLGPKDLASPVGLRRGYVSIAPRGTPADPLILQSAKELRAPVVTNDRFRDWEETYPHLKAPGFLVSGTISQGAVHLPMH